MAPIATLLHSITKGYSHIYILCEARFVRQGSYSTLPEELRRDGANGPGLFAPSHRKTPYYER